MPTWPGGGKGLPLQGSVLCGDLALKAHGRVACPGGPCFAAVLEPFKWTMATWPGAGKGLPLQGNVLCGDFGRQWQSAKGPRQGCVSWWTVHRGLEPFKWTMATWPGAGKGLPLQGNVLCGDLGRQWQSAKGPRGLRVLVDRASRRF